MIVAVLNLGLIVRVLNRGLRNEEIHLVTLFKKILYFFFFSIVFFPFGFAERGISAMYIVMLSLCCAHLTSCSVHCRYRVI